MRRKEVNSLYRLLLEMDIPFSPIPFALVNAIDTCASITETTKKLLDDSFRKHVLFDENMKPKIISGVPVPEDSVVDLKYYVYESGPEGLNSMLNEWRNIEDEDVDFLPSPLISLNSEILSDKGGTVLLGSYLNSPCCCYKPSQVSILMKYGIIGQ